MVFHHSYRRNDYHPYYGYQQGPYPYWQHQQFSQQFYPYGGQSFQQPQLQQPQQPQQTMQGQMPFNQAQAAPFVNMFQTPDGKFDFQKAMTTFDQVMKTANQISPIMKQLGTLFTAKK